MSIVYKNLFPIEDLTLLIKHFDSQSYSHIQEYNNTLICKNKNLDYQVPNTPVYNIVRPRIQEILGDHNISCGSYKESYTPYSTHVDGRMRPDIVDGTITQIETGFNHDVAIIIPLSESPAFKTVTFKAYDAEYAGMGTALKEEWLHSSNELDLNEFDHIDYPVRQDLLKLELDTVFSWQMGDAFSWTRDQLHSSTNFAKHNLVKKFMILFIV